MMRGVYSDKPSVDRYLMDLQAHKGTLELGISCNCALYPSWYMLVPIVAPSTTADYREAWTKGRVGNPVATPLEKAISSFHFSCFTLAAGWLPPGPSWVATVERWPRSHGHRLTLLFMAWACLTAAPEMGNIAHLAGLLGAVMPQRPAL